MGGVLIAAPIGASNSAESPWATLDTTVFEMAPRGDINILRVANQSGSAAKIKIFTTLGGVNEYSLPVDVTRSFWLELPYFVQPNGRVRFQVNTANVLASHIYLEKRGISPQPRVATF